MSLFKKILELLTGGPTINHPKALTDRRLIEMESRIGRELFGPIPAGHRRDFFCLDDKTWVWHEEWRDEDNKPQSSTTRYEVQPNGILKAQEGHVYKYIEGEELTNLTIAVELYYRRCMTQIYKLDPITGRSLIDTAEPATM